MSPERAKVLTKVARRRSEFPAICGLFDEGQLSIEQVATCVAAPAWADAQVADIARVCTVSQLRHHLRSDRFVEPEPDPIDATPESPETPDPPDDEHTYDSPSGRVSFGTTDDGRWTIRGEFDLLTGRRIEAALTERRDALFRDGDEHVTWADAMLDCFERSLDSADSESRRDRFRTWLHLDVTAGAATTTDGWRIPMALADRVLCDGVVQPVWERDGVPFSVGRSQHIVPERTRRIIERRDGGCRVPGCDAHRLVEIHHIRHWLDGGPSDTWNLLSLCPYHHRLHHQGKLGVSGNADDPFGIMFTDGEGRVIEPVGRPVAPTGPPPAPLVGHSPAERGGRFRLQSPFIHPEVLRRRAESARRLWATTTAA